MDPPAVIGLAAGHKLQPQSKAVGAPPTRLTRVGAGARSARLGPMVPKSCMGSAAGAHAPRPPDGPPPQWRSAGGRSRSPAARARIKRQADRAASRPDKDVDEAWEDAEDEREEAEALHAEATAADAAEAARKEEDALVEECASAVIHAEDNRYIYRGCGK